LTNSDWHSPNPATHAVLDVPGGIYARSCARVTNWEFFNVKGGAKLVVGRRNVIEMNFLLDVYVQCEVCGAR